MKIGILGGTFDPIHIGHLIAAEWTKEEQKLDEVWFMPSASPPHKNQVREASPEERLEMVELAIADCPHYKVTDIEVRRGGTSYTYDTILHLKQLQPQVHFSFIIGADMVDYLPQWHNIHKLVEEISFIGLQRPGTDLDLQQLPDNLRKAVRMSPMPQIDISSTVIRERRRAGLSIRYMVPDVVERFMEEKRLYEA